MDYDSAFADLNKALVDLDGDGKPDAVAPRAKLGANRLEPGEVAVQPGDTSSWWDRVKAAWASGGWQDPQPGQRGTFVPSRINEQGKAEPAVPGIIQQPAESLQSLMTAPLSDIVRSGDRDAIRAAAEASFDVSSMLPAAGVAAGRMRPRGTAPDRAPDPAPTPQPREYSTGPEQIVPDHVYGTPPYQPEWPYITRPALGQELFDLDPRGIHPAEAGAPGARVLKYQDMPARMKTVGQDPVPGVRGMDGRPVYSNPDDPNTAAILAAMQGQDKPKGITAYHGSPHDFDRFDMSKIGTGEGAQAYGHGLYFADNPKVARAYEGMLAGNGYDPAVIARDALEDAGGNVANALAKITKETPPKMGLPEFDILTDNYGIAQELLKKHAAGEPMPLPAKGRMYEVNINANPEDFLDWDKPFREQPEKIQKAIEQALARADNVGAKITPEDEALLAALGPISEAEKAYDPFSGLKGSNLLSTLESRLSRPSAADAMKELGIPGIKYLDQGSRVAGEGSRNYVVFDDALVDILRKYSNPNDPTTAAILALLSQQQGGQQQQ